MNTALVIATFCTAGGAFGATIIGVLVLIRAHFLKNFGKHRVLEIHQSAAASRISAKLNQVSRDQMTVTIRTGDSTVNISGPTNTQILNAVSNALAANETLQSPNPTVSSRHKPRN